MKRSTLFVTILLGIVALSVIAILVAVALQSPVRRQATGDVIRFITLNGAIADGEADSLIGASGGINPSFVRHRIQDAEDDPSVKAIIFKVNSPGGTVGASQEIAEEIRRCSKPIVIFAGDTVASGAYYISSQADKIVAKPGSLVGSIGVISRVSDLTGLYNKLGIKMQTIKSGKNKDMFERTLTPEERQKFQAMSDELYRQFVTDVARGRKLSKDKVTKLATGEVFAATRAKELGLVDVIGSYQTAIDEAAQLAHVDDPVVDEYESPTVFEELFGGPSSRIYALARAYLLGRDLLLLENVRTMLTGPQYRYVGGQ